VADLHEGGDAAAVRHVGLGERDAARRDELAKLVDRVQVLPGGDGQPALAHDAHMTGHVVGDRRLLQPHRRGGRQGARGADGLVDAPAHVRVDHQRELRTEMGAHRPHAAHVIRERRAPDLHLDRAKAARQVLVGLAQQRVEREVEIDAARIARHARVEPAQHLPEGCPLAAGAQVPERDVDRRHGERLGAAAAAVVERPPHGLPQAFDALGVAPYQNRRQVARDQRVYGGSTCADGVGVACALRAFVVAHAHSDQLEAPDGPVRAVGERHWQRDAVVIGADLLDQHGTPVT